MRQLIEAHNLEVDQAPLTGESVPVEKAVALLPKDTPLADRKNILYTITTVTYGRGKAVVFSTSMNTELGKVATSDVQAIDVQKTPFENENQTNRQNAHYNHASHSRNC